VKKAVQFGCAVNADIALHSRFDRKSYFYPDSPRNFQITQFDEPILKGGSVTAEVEGVTQHFALHHAHLEDDSGMLKHFSTFAGIDYNRAGAPLLEIVSEPCMHSPKEASAYATAVRALMHYIDASDCNMEEGSLRIDVNISVRPKGESTLRPKVEIKNLNSFHNMELAIAAEVLRQIRLYESRPHEDPKKVLPSGTYRFDLDKKETVLMRQKEEAEDYRYFPEPDLPPIVLMQEEIEAVKAALPELPHERFCRYVKELHLPVDAATLLTQERAFADYFEAALKVCNQPKSVCNWITVEFVGRFKESGISLLTSGIAPHHIGTLVKLIESGTITGKIAKAVADEMVKHPGKDPTLIVQENPDFQPLQNSSIEPLVDAVLSANPESVADFKAGKGRAFDYLVGQVMKQCKGKASPAVVNQLLKAKLDKK
jgi:aspartyl-tRNA(Asn)/glutamyl-tRNA(Gln) amidotransferase subunit B